MAEDDHHLGNLKFISKGKEDEVFGMQIPKELITDNIWNAPYYNAYLEMVAKHDRKIAAEEGGKKMSTSKADQSKKLATAKQIPVTEEASTGPFAQHEDNTSINIVCDTPSPTDAETCAETNKTNSEGDIEILNIGKEQGEDVANKVDLEEKTVEVDEGHGGSDHGPNPEPMHEDFVATVYPQVHESLKHTYEEHVHLENPLSSTGTLSSMKNLDNFNFGLSSRVFTLELQDLPYKIDQTVNEAVKEAVQIALQAPLRECFRDLSEADMKEILHEWMFENGSYRSQPEHFALYEALEASMERDNRDEFLADRDKSRKRRRDDQDPPPPPI
ncbi:hypothetical protein Tco_1179755 [Tanacetum coccineum]